MPLHDATLAARAGSVNPDGGENARGGTEPAFTTRGESGGWGLGLAICRELAQANDGAVELLPAEPGGGGGARFRVTIPAQAAPTAS